MPYPHDYEGPPEQEVCQLDLGAKRLSFQWLCHIRRSLDI